KENIILLKYPIYIWFIAMLAVIIGATLVSEIFAGFFKKKEEKEKIITRPVRWAGLIFLSFLTLPCNNNNLNWGKQNRSNNFIQPHGNTRRYRKSAVCFVHTSRSRDEDVFLNSEYRTVSHQKSKRKTKLKRVCRIVC
ncbi:MAG: hypothetical protein RMJ89_05160, partial [Flammeovirgaceae bacterium]|nr:hypothetical protein [Flammeovirgaceae bacterium]